MPQLGETVTEGKITNWYKSVGDTVSAGETLFEIETDKTSMEVPTTAAGTLQEIRVSAGETVPVGAIVAVLAGEHRNDRASSDSTDPASESPPAKIAFDPSNAVRSPAVNYGPAAQKNGTKATPLARRLAMQSGVDISTAAGSGPHGRVIAADIRALINSAGTKLVGSSDGPPRAPAAGPVSGQIGAMYADVKFHSTPVDAMRRIIAKRLTEAKNTIPHFYLTSEICLDRLTALRSELKAQCGDSLKPSINDFVIKALASALQQVPEANAVWAGDVILRFDRSDIGIAVAVEGGLFTPIIRAADIKSVGAISTEMKSLIERARAKTLKPSEYQGGSISISNLGMFGVSSFSAIINPPQAAILAVGAIERQPRESPDGNVRFVDVMKATLSCDHRVIDGVLGAQLLASFKDFMQSPLSLLI